MKSAPTFVPAPYDAARDATLDPAPGDAAVDWDSGPPLARELFGTWLFVAAETMLFAALFGVVVLLRDQTDGFARTSAHVVHRFAFVAAASLALGSVFAVLAGRAARAGRLQRALVCACALLACGAASLVASASDWRAWNERGITPRTDLGAASWYVVTAVHGAHVLLGLAWAAWWVARRASHRAWSCIALYWHFVVFVGLVQLVVSSP